LKKIVEQYFSILDDYFGEAYKIASEKGFVKNDYWNKVDEIYDPVTILSWARCMKTFRKQIGCLRNRIQSIHLFPSPH
jgi:hypothetical protein